MMTKTKRKRNGEQQKNDQWRIVKHERKEKKRVSTCNEGFLAEESYTDNRWLLSRVSKNKHLSCQPLILIP